MLSAIMFSMLGEYTSPTDQINQKILSYKSDYLYSHEYKKCVQSGFYSTYLFNEPISCVNENFIQGAMSIYGIKSVFSDLPDSIHVLKKYQGNDLSAETISNKKGQIMLLSVDFNFNEKEKEHALVDMVKVVTSKFGGAVVRPTGEDQSKPYAWITSDNYDLTVNRTDGGVRIRYVNRDAYATFNQNKLILPTS